MEYWNIDFIKDIINFVKMNFTITPSSQNPMFHYSSIPSFHGSGINQELLKDY